MSVASASRSDGASCPRPTPTSAATSMPYPTASPWRNRLYFVMASSAVAGGVAEVEHASRAAFALVARDHVGLDPAAFGDHRLEDVRITLEELLDRAADAIEQAAARGHAVLDDFVEPGPELPSRKARDQQGIDHHEPRLVKRADQVLAQRMVHAHLAADGAVDLRQQGRRDVHDVDPAQIGRGRKAGDIADDAASEADQGRAAVDLLLDQRVVDPRHRLKVLVAFPVGHHDHGDIGQRRGGGVAVNPPHGRARHQHPSSSHTGAVEQCAQPGEMPRANLDGIRARRNLDEDLFRGQRQHHDVSRERMVG